MADILPNQGGPEWVTMPCQDCVRLTAENAALRETLEKVHGLLPPAGWPNNSLLCDPIRALIEARIPELKGTHDHQDR